MELVKTCLAGCEHPLPTVDLHRELIASGSAARPSRSRGAGAGPRLGLVSLPGRIPIPPGLGSVIAGRIEGTLGSVETVIGGIERAFGRLHLGQGIGERILGRGQPAPQIR
jgi:hypothetical protein